MTNSTGDLVSIDLIVVGVDATDTALAAAEEAAELARRLDAKLHIVSAVTSDTVTTVDVGGATVSTTSLDQTEERLADVASRLPRDLEITTAAAKGKPAEVLVDQAQAAGADMIVVGSKRMTGIGRLLGSVANDVAHHAPCSVYIAKTAR